MVSSQDIPQLVSLYTDGACSGNPGPGGWGAVAYFDDKSCHEIGGADRQTTNNRMELQAAIAALALLDTFPHQQPITLHSDSKYVIDGITKWIRGWKRKGWKTSTGKAVLNQDLWQALDQVNQSWVNWRYVRGHSGDLGNERCDAIARGFSTGHPPTLRRQITTSPTETRKTEDSQSLSLRDNNLRSGSLPPVETLVTVDSIETTKPHGNGLSSSQLSLTDPLSDSEAMTESTVIPAPSDTLSREVRVGHLRNLIETLRVADEVADKGYLITSAELADLMDVNASAVTSRGDNWVWRNWVVTRMRREGNQILWQLERIEDVA
ncbi:MAG: ribonuclease HI [Cyanobacteria bacterium P01_C01_bin.89]